jgi:hypothetical protein
MINLPKIKYITVMKENKINKNKKIKKRGG